MNHYFYIFGSKTYYNIAWNEVRHSNQIRYIDSILDGTHSVWLQVGVRLCFNLYLQHLIPSQLKERIYKRLYNISAQPSQQLCFLFFECWYSAYTTGYVEYLRKQYPNAKFILYLQDIVASNPLFNIQKLRKQFDDIFSYDQHDATQYNLHYLPTPYSALPELLNNTSISYDMFFCGNAKNRLSEIMAVYYSATNAGLSCLFYINDVPKKHQQHLPGIIYNHTISYNDCVKKTIYAKCIVEIMQHGADGYTPRLWEAITYNKHLLTNNQFIESSPFAHPCIHYFTSEIDWSWINTKASYPTEWHIKLSPIQCLTQIEKYL